MQCVSLNEKTTNSNTSMINITAELGRALAVVKVTLQVNGNSQFLGVRPPAPENYWGDKDKIWQK